MPSNCVQNSPAQTIPQVVISHSLFFYQSTFYLSYKPCIEYWMKWSKAHSQTTLQGAQVPRKQSTLQGAQAHRKQTTLQGVQLQAPRKHSNYTSRCTSTQKTNYISRCTNTQRTLKLHCKVHKHTENKLHFKVYKHTENTQTTLQGVQAPRKHSNYTARCTSTQKTLKLHCKVFLNTQSETRLQEVQTPRKRARPTLRLDCKRWPLHC